MVRLFLAINLPTAVRLSLIGLCAGLPEARWAPPEQMHLTLRFIGEVEGGLFRDIRESLHGVEAEPFSLTLKGLGFFPPRKEPRVLWVGTDQSAQLLQLKQRVDAALRPAGVAPDDRKFHPHVTLARFRAAPGPRLGHYLAAHGLFRTEPFPVEEFHLFSSFLGSKGAIHTVEATYPLVRRAA